MRKSNLLEALFPPARRKILGATFLQPEREWYLTELAGFIRTRPSSLQREVDALVNAGVLHQRRDGRRVYLQPDRTSPTYAELRGLLEKTVGIVPVLRSEFQTLGASVRLALLFGSMARGAEGSGSDVDVLVVGSAGFSDLVPMLKRVEKQLGRPVNPVVYSPKEFRAKARDHDHFLTTVLAGELQFIAGDQDELARLLGTR